MRKLGYYIFASDEEGHIIFNNETTLKRNPIDAFNVIDKYLAWGSEQADILKDEYKKIENKLIICGNPRLDILKNPVNKIFLKSSEKKFKKSMVNLIYILVLSIDIMLLGNNNNWEKNFKKCIFQNEKVKETTLCMLFLLQKKNMVETINFFKF